MINYSFIIPHKNVPHLLERCILSIPCRDDVEIIVVDDNSTDKEALYGLDCLKVGNVQLLCMSESRGAGVARNEGIKVAKGKWLLFADADDFYTENISVVLDKYVTDEITDVVYLNAQAINEEGVVFPLAMGKYIDNYKRKRFYSENVLRFANWVPWTRMVKREMVERYNIRYEEIPVGNDAMFCLTCSKYAVNIQAESLEVYRYYKPSEGSCTHHYYNLPNLNSMVDLKYRINGIYSDVGFVFKLSFIQALFVDSKMENEQEYKNLYKAALKRNGYSIITDCVNFIIYYLGKIINVI